MSIKMEVTLTCDKKGCSKAAVFNKTPPPYDQDTVMWTSLLFDYPKWVRTKYGWLCADCYNAWDDFVRANSAARHNALLIGKPEPAWVQLKEWVET